MTEEMKQKLAKIEIDRTAWEENEHQKRIEKINGIIEFYEDCIKEAPHIKAVLQQFDGNQLNKRFYDALTNGYSWGGKIYLKIGPCNDASFCARFEMSRCDTFCSIINYQVYHDTPPYTKIIGKTQRLDAQKLMDSVDVRVKDIRKRIDNIKLSMRTIDDDIAQYNHLGKQIEAIKDKLPYDVRQVFADDFNRIYGIH